MGKAAVFLLVTCSYIVTVRRVNHMMKSTGRREDENYGKNPDYWVTDQVLCGVYFISGTSSKDICYSPLESNFCTFQLIFSWRISIILLQTKWKIIRDRFWNIKTPYTVRGVLFVHYNKQVLLHCEVTLRKWEEKYVLISARWRELCLNF